jgi:hypothetical protein
VPTVFFFICEVFVEGHQIGKQADGSRGASSLYADNTMSCLRANGAARFMEIGFVVVLAPLKHFSLDLSGRDNWDGFGNSESGLKSRDVHFGRVAQLVRAPASHAGGHRFESCRAHHPRTCESSTCNFDPLAFPALILQNVSEPYQNPAGPETTYQNA